MVPLCGPHTLPRTLTCWNLFSIELLGGLKVTPTLYQWSKSTDGCLKELKWSILASWQLYQCVIMLHSIMNNQTPINFCHHFNFNTNTTRSHPLTLQTWSSSMNTFRYSLFMSIPFVWTYEILSTSLNSFRLRLWHYLFSWYPYNCFCLYLLLASHCLYNAFCAVCVCIFFLGDHLVQALSLLCTLSFG